MSGSRHYKKSMPKDYYPTDEESAFDGEFILPMDPSDLYDRGRSHHRRHHRRVSRAPRDYTRAADEMWRTLEGLEAIGELLDEYSWNNEDRFEMLLDHVEHMAKELSRYGPDIKPCYCILCARGYSESLYRESAPQQPELTSLERRELRQRIANKLKADYDAHVARKKAKKDWRKIFMEGGESSRAPSTAQPTKKKHRNKGKEPDWEGEQDTEDREYTEPAGREWGPSWETEEGDA